MSAQVTQEMQRLQDELVVLGGSVENAILCLLGSLERHGAECTAELSANCRRIAQKRFLIEAGTLSLLTFPALSQDALRKAVATMEVAGELDRVADGASRLVEACRHRSGDFSPDQIDGLHRMTTGLLTLLHRALVAFARWDADLARATIVAASDLGAVYEQARRELFDATARRPEAPVRAAYLANAAYGLKRAADRVAGCCDWIVFAADGSLEPAHRGDEFQTLEELHLQPEPVGV